MREFHTAVMDDRCRAHFERRPDDRDSETIASFDILFRAGSKKFLHKATNRRWKDVPIAQDLKRYLSRTKNLLAAKALTWLAPGRSAA
jgi:hypothetical protein